jgi:adhesin transport system membrane fusion protein
VLRASDAAVGQASVDALSVRATRLAAEARGQRPSFDMPGVDPAAVATEQALARSDSAALGTERSMAMARQEQASRAAAEADATLRQKQEALRLAQREEAVMRPLVEQGAEPGLTLDRVTSQRVQAESGVRAADENLRRARAAVAEARRGVWSVDMKFRNRAAEARAVTQAEWAGRSGQQPALADRLEAEGYDRFTETADA